MTGFIRGLFRRNRAPRAPKPPRQQQSFFLDADEAKTYGDIDYMRSSKVIRRTFARKQGQAEELESVRQVSAMEKRDMEAFNRNGASPSSTESSPSAPSFDSARSTSEAPKFQRRQADNSMEQFRNMARELRKK